MRSGGIILTPFGSPFRNGCLSRLVVTDGGRASGRFVDDANFMWMGPGGGPGDVMAQVDHRDSAADTVIDFDPRQVLGDDAAHAIGLLLPDVWRSVGHGTGPSAGELTLWLADPASRSWAAIDYQPGRTEFEVSHYGPRPLHRELRGAYHWWRSAGQPSRFRFGLTVDPDENSAGQTAWLDSVDNPVPSVVSTVSD